VRARRWLGRALLLLPGLSIVGVDVALRSDRLLHGTTVDTTLYVAAAAVGVALWSALVVAATSRSGMLRWASRALLASLSLLAVGGQLYTFHRYRAFLDTDSMLVGTGMLASIRQQLWFDRGSFLRAILPPLLAVVAVALLHRRLAVPRRSTSRMATDAGVVLLCVVGLYPPQGSHVDSAPFDVLYLTSVGQLARAVWDHNPCVARTHPGPRTPIPVPALAAKPERPRNVLFVLTESVRAKSTCVAYDPDCKMTPFSNALVPARFPFLQMRSLDSTTAISLGVAWSGIAPRSTREELHSAPLVWEYAQQAGLDTAYWTSQNLLFGNSGAWLASVPWKHHINATEIDPDCTLETGAPDGQLVSYVNDHLADLKEPFLAVVHLSNTHFPYDIDENDAPFQPQGMDTGPGHGNDVVNRYQDAIYLQDRAIARLIAAERARPEGARTVIVFLSDHGEQIYEKGAVGHTGTLFEPEIHIPAWIDAPPGTLSPREEDNLKKLRDRPLLTIDVLPTLLDLMGVLDAPEVAPFKKSFVGTSLLRGGSPVDQPVVLTNCTDLWACAFRNWGAIQGTRKLVGTESDRQWSCFDVIDDPDEVHDLGAAGCGALAQLTEASHHGRPF